MPPVLLALPPTCCSHRLASARYSVLSDPHERSWYDRHRQSILRDEEDVGDGAGGVGVGAPNLFAFFSSSAYDGFGDDAGGFFGVYGRAFASVDAVEEGCEGVGEYHAALPEFGDALSAWQDMARFYREWSNYVTAREFHHADKYNTGDAPDRRYRRAMEAENKKLRGGARKEWIELVRSLAAFAKKRDPRVQRHAEDAAQAKMAAAVAQRNAKAAGRAEQLRNAERLQAEAAQAQAELDAQMDADVASGRTVLAFASDEEDDEGAGDADEAVEWYCEACRKAFKSENQWSSHERSKKHRQKVQSLVRAGFDVPLPPSAAPVVAPEPAEEELEEVEAARAQSDEGAESDGGGEQIGGTEQEGNEGGASDQGKAPRRRRRRRRGDGPADSGERLATGSDAHCCRACGGAFPSGNQLQAHLDSTGHAVAVGFELAAVDAEERAGKGKGKRGKGKGGNGVVYTQSVLI